MQMKKTYLPGQRIYYVATALLLLGLLTAVVCDMGNWQFALSSPCFLNRYCHLYCPGCGGTRAAFALIHGKLVSSILYNPIPLYMAGLFLYYYIGTTLAIWSKGRRVFFKPGWWMVVIFVILIVWTFGIRNVLAVKYGIDYIGEVAPYWGR